MERVKDSGQHKRDREQKERVSRDAIEKIVSTGAQYAGLTPVANAWFGGLAAFDESSIAV